MPIKPIEVFQFLKPEYIFIAKEAYGVFYAFSEKPVLSWKGDCWVISRFAESCTLFAIDIDYTDDWKDSLIERPKE